MVEPKVRFKQDDGSSFPKWINCQFMSLIERIIDFRGRTPKKLGMEWVEGKTDYMALSALNVKSGYIDFSADPHYGDKRLYEKWMSGNELRKGQVLFTTEAPMGNVAQVPDDKPYILSQRTIAFNVIENKINEGYLSYLLLSPNVQTALSQLATGGTATGVSQKSLVKLFVTIPSSLNEQQEIADFLSSVDEVIAASELEVANLEIQKKAVMKKIFSQEVRFKREDGTEFPEWEQKKLGDIADFITKGTTPKEYVEDSDIRFVRIDSISDGSIQADRCLRIDEATHNKALARSILQENDILCSIAGALGVIAIVPRQILPANTNQALAIIRLPKNKNHQYIAQFLGSFVMEEFIRESKTVGAQPNLSLAQINDIDLAYPCIEEQRLIADFLSNFDEAIAAAKKELELWKELKKGLLQQMFV